MLLSHLPLLLQGRAHRTRPTPPLSPAPNALPPPTLIFALFSQSPFSTFSFHIENKKCLISFWGAQEQLSMQEGWERRNGGARGMR